MSSIAAARPVVPGPFAPLVSRETPVSRKTPGTARAGLGAERPDTYAHHAGLRTAGLVAEPATAYPSSASNRSKLPAREVDRHLKSELDHMRRAEGRAVIWFGEVVRRKLFRKLGYASIHEYAKRELGFSESKTFQFLRLATRLQDLPELRRGVESGDLPWTKARVLIPVATRRNESKWLEQARSHPRHVLEKRVRAAQNAATQKRCGTPQPALALSPPESTAPASSASSPSPRQRGASGGGSLTRTSGETGPRTELPGAPVTITLRLEPHQYALYQSLVETVRKQGHREPREDLILGALEMMALAGAGRRQNQSKLPEHDRAEQTVPIASARSAAVQLDSEETTSGVAGMKASKQWDRDQASTSGVTGTEKVSGGGTGSAATNSATATCEAGCHCTRVQWVARSPYQVTVYLCAQCGRGEVPTSQGPRKIAPDRLQAILCDAHVQPVGKRNRATIPPSVRRMVLTRDRHECRVAGCRNTRFLQVHHLIPREVGGPNEPGNLITLCSACHLWAHEAGHPERTATLTRNQRTG